MYQKIWWKNSDF